MNHEDVIAGKLAEHLADLRTSLDSVGRHLKEALAALPVVPDEIEVAADISEELKAQEPPAPPPPPPAALNNALLYRTAAIEFGKNQSDILEALVQGLQDFAERGVILILREDAAQAWSGFGFEGVRSWKTTLSADPILRTVVTSKTRMLLDGAVPSFIPAGPPVRRSLITPLLLKGKVSALVYADTGENGKLDHYSVDVLVRVASLVIDIFPLREKRSPLPPVLENQGIIMPGFSEAPVPQPEDNVLFEDSGVLASAQPAEELPSNQTIQAVIPQPAPVQEPQEPEVVEEAEAAEEAPEAPSESPTESTAPSRPKDEPIPAGEEKFHEDAQRFARLLVQEIVLYHPREVEQGKSKHNLHALLRDDIERSREAYQNRFQRPSIQSRRYFDKALVKYLADDDPALLGG